MLSLALISVSALTASTMRHGKKVVKQTIQENINKAYDMASTKILADDKEVPKLVPVPKKNTDAVTSQSQRDCITPCELEIGTIENLINFITIFYVSMYSPT